MSNSLGFLVTDRDLMAIVIAAVIGTFAAATAIELLRHACRMSGLLRTLWLGVAAIACGTGIWATHFVAILSCELGKSSGYDATVTLLSLIYAVAITGAGLAIACRGHPPWAAPIGGVVIGVGIAVMHYTGMAALRTAGTITWNTGLVAVSVLLAGLFGAASLFTALHRPSIVCRLGGALLLVAAICLNHATGMAAMTLVPDPGVVVPESALSAHWLAVAVVLASLTILFLACAALGLDIRARNLAAREDARLRSLANAAVEGLLICQGDTIVNANHSFARLVGMDETALRGTALSAYLPGVNLRDTRFDGPDELADADLNLADGTAVPVELVVRPVVYGNRPHHAVAVRDIRATRRAEHQIRYLVDHDALTGLPNRTGFNASVDRAIGLAAASGRRLAVISLDLDRFIEVNDLYGEAAGDAVLVQVADTIRTVLDDTQVAGRLGGDDFAVLTFLDQADAGERLADRIIAALRAVDAGVSGRMPIAATLGIAHYPDHAADRTGLLTAADTALSWAKAHDRGGIRRFESTIGADMRERRGLDHQLRTAIAQDAMFLAYQPQMRAGTKAVTGFEVLLRWRDAKRGLVSPSVFIPIAEESGLILEIGTWVLRQACREAVRWSNPLAVAVNVSGSQILDPGFVDQVRDILRETGLAPARLEIEITETALIRDPMRAHETLRGLKALGLSIAMDDFGTGYSSLSNLRSFPFDRIKIDGSFVAAVDSNAQAAAIVRSVIGLARGLGLAVVAEGVETAEELRFLEAERCDEVQGYFIGRPDTIDRFVDLTGRRDAPDLAA